MSISLLANAKINPTLRVLGRRTDGLHELVMTMLALDLGDAVTVSSSAGGPEAEGGLASLEVAARVSGDFASPDIPTDGGNLAVRGAMLGRGAAGATRGLAVDLIKNVPSRAGLGGGSADAAAAARAAFLECSGAALEPGAGLGDGLGDGLGELGADCAFFHAARETGAALALGTGVELVPLDGPADWWVALITPEVECSTPVVYGALEAGPVTDLQVHRSRAESDARDLFHLSALEARAALVNDLEAPARRAIPGLEPWFTLLDEAGESHFRLAGSGSSFFGLFPDASSAAETLGLLERRAAGRGLGVRLSTVARPAGSALTSLAGDDLG
ncbi:MAG: hypothetical protein P8M11_05115 [Planctomycetota bacterium]|nr:hypothetical protein [Planctomycetota bacterium]MDG1983925.1 hypothetical protein [Planctomycetota bacterium]